LRENGVAARSPIIRIFVMSGWKDSQNPDGGWAYGRGCSWTEPTAFVLLAQLATGMDNDTDKAGFEAGLRFLRSTQREDGGWSPQPGVSESTWVTSLAALLPEQALGERRVDRAIAWLSGQTGRESGWAFRLQQRLRGVDDPYPQAWPWFPGAAAWVIPTSFGILALERSIARRGSSHLRGRVSFSRIRDRVATAKEFLFDRMCADGGWNHGSNRALGRDGDSYPETTGIALLALNGAPPSPQIDRAKAAARRHLASCRTAEGVAWLRMGLAAHGEIAQSPRPLTPRTTVDRALLTLAAAPRNPLLSAS
jgi:hypothetical protein